VRVLLNDKAPLPFRDPADGNSLAAIASISIVRDPSACASIAKNTSTDLYSFMLEYRRVLAWLWRTWAATPLVVASGSLLIGYLRASERLHPLVDLLESVVGLGFSGLVCMPLIIAACYLHRDTRLVTPPSSVPPWLVWVPLAMVLPLGLCMFITYLFGDLGMLIRGFTRSIFEHG